jgi:proliferating cell nuclear antigen
MSAKMILDPQLARQFINIMGAVVDEFKLQINKYGWTVVAVDPANVAMVFVNLPKDNFQSYEFESDTYTSSVDGHPTGVLQDNIEVGINVKEIKKFFGGITKKAEIVLDEEMHAPVEFIFSIASEKHCGRYQLELNQGMFYRKILLLPEKEIRKTPGKLVIYSDYKLQIGTLELLRIVIKAVEINDYIRLGFRHGIIREMTDDPERHKEKHTITFIASMVDCDGFPWDATKQIDNWQALRDNASDSSSSLFSLDYLCDIVEVIPLGKLWLHIGQDNPCKMSFNLGTGNVEYWMAPRIESE